jgi:hypothetical protein
MTLTDIANARLINQQLADTHFKTANEIVSCMGAMQAQDYAMAKWAIGVRLPGSTDTTIQAAIDKGEIIRTHLLRPTWHLVSADDIYWLLELTGPRLINSLKTPYRWFELDENVFKKSHAVMEKALRNNSHLTRDELLARLNAENINTEGLRSLHLLIHAELEGLICSGCYKDKSQTYALLHERVLETSKLTKDEALGKLAERYFSSHGPATIADFAWWANLKLADARHGLEMVKNNFIAIAIDKQTFWMSNDLAAVDFSQNYTYILPAFDEFLISYADRTAAIVNELQNRAFTNNGIFKPVIIEKGQVIGTWKRTITKEKVIIEPAFFKPQSNAAINRITKAARSFGRFLDKKVEIV